MTPRPAGARLLDDVHQALTRYVVLPSPEAADAVVLWIAATHAVPAWEHATRLVIKSPEKRCGKSRLLDVIEATCHRPLITVNISPAALVRSVGHDDPPTILLDEADTVFGRKAAENNEDLRGILNAGHQRSRPYLRWDANARKVENCPTFSMAALAGIGSMPDTIEDRAVVVTMRRRAPGETVAPFRTRRDGPALASLRDHLHQWMTGRADDLKGAVPVMPVEDRAADTWEPLVAVADIAGADWPARARKAALVMSAEDDQDATVGIRLLADLRDVFGDQDAMHGETILAELHKMDEAPWGNWFGRTLNAYDLAKMLKPYRVRSVDVKIAGVNKKGYRRDHLHDPWSSYLPPVEGGSATPATAATGHVNDGVPVAGSGQQALPATGRVPLTSDVAQVAQVALPPGGSGTAAATCAGCGDQMTVIEPGQRYHPMCEPDSEIAS